MVTLICAAVTTLTGLLTLYTKEGTGWLRILLYIIGVNGKMCVLSNGEWNAAQSSGQEPFCDAV